jgi:hypothetical protein
MKKNILKYITIATVLFQIVSCTVIRPVTASNAEIGTKRGISESAVLFNAIYLNNNYGVKEAANNGNINSAIATIDEKTVNYFFFSKKTLIVTAK